MGKYAKNFIPILANLIAPVSGEKGDASRLSALETLKCYLKVADKKVTDVLNCVNNLVYNLIIQWKCVSIEKVISDICLIYTLD